MTAHAHNDGSAPKKKGGLLKFVLALPLVLILLLIVGVLVAAFYIDTIAKTGVEKGGTYALGVPTTLDSADVRLLSGGVSLSGLNVANPTGFKTPHFLALNDGNVDVSLASLRSDTVEVSNFELAGIDINLEKSSQGANYKTILENLKKLEGSGSSAPPPDKGSGKEFVIRKLTLSDINVHADVLPIGGEATRVNARIDRIELTDVGSKQGVDMSELTSIILKALLTSIANSGIGLPADLMGELQGGLSQLTSLADNAGSVIANVGGQVEAIAGDATKQLEGVADELKKGAEGIDKEVDKVKQEAEKALEGVGGLLGGGKKKDN